MANSGREVLDEIFELYPDNDDDELIGDDEVDLDLLCEEHDDKKAVASTITETSSVRKNIVSNTNKAVKTSTSPILVTHTSRNSSNLITLTGSGGKDAILVDNDDEEEVEDEDHESRRHEKFRSERSSVKSVVITNRTPREIPDSLDKVVIETKSDGEKKQNRNGGQGQTNSRGANVRRGGNHGSPNATISTNQVSFIQQHNQLSNVQFNPPHSSHSNTPKIHINPRFRPQLPQLPERYPLGGQLALLPQPVSHSNFNQPHPPHFNHANHMPHNQRPLLEQTFNGNRFPGDMRPPFMQDQYGQNRPNGPNFNDRNRQSQMFNANVSNIQHNTHNNQNLIHHNTHFRHDQVNKQGNEHDTFSNANYGPNYGPQNRLQSGNQAHPSFHNSPMPMPMCHEVASQPRYEENLRIGFNPGNQAAANRPLAPLGPRHHHDQFMGNGPQLRHQFENRDMNFGGNNNAQYNTCPPPGLVPNVPNIQNRFMSSPQLHIQPMNNQPSGMMAPNSVMSHPPGGQFFQPNQPQFGHDSRQQQQMSTQFSNQGNGQYCGQSQPPQVHSAPWPGPQGDGPRPPFHGHRQASPRVARPLLPTPTAIAPRHAGILDSSPRFRALRPHVNSPHEGKKRPFESSPHQHVNGKVLKVLHTSSGIGSVMSDSTRMANVKMAKAKLLLVKKNMSSSSVEARVNVNVNANVNVQLTEDEKYQKELEKQKKAREEFIRRKEERRKQMIKEKMASTS